jgi:hypothetical protein
VAVVPVNWPSAPGSTPAHALTVVTATGTVLASFRMAEVGGYSIEASASLVAPAPAGALQVCRVPWEGLSMDEAERIGVLQKLLHAQREYRRVSDDFYQAETMALRTESMNPGEREDWAQTLVFWYMRRAELMQQVVMAAERWAAIAAALDTPHDLVRPFDVDSFLEGFTAERREVPVDPDSPLGKAIVATREHGIPDEPIDITG